MVRSCCAVRPVFSAAEFETVDGLRLLDLVAAQRNDPRMIGLFRFEGHSLFGYFRLHRVCSVGLLKLNIVVEAATQQTDRIINAAVDINGCASRLFTSTLNGLCKANWIRVLICARTLDIMTERCSMLRRT